MTKPIKMELFRAGLQTDSKGGKKTWSKSDLDTIVSNFNENDKVPACIGHPSTNEPAMGWFNKVWRKGDVLFGELGDRVDEFSTILKNKMFPRRSIALDSKLNLKHVAFLGVTRPAVKGLENFAFSKVDDLTIIEFSSFNERFAFKSIARLFTNIREKMIEKDGIEKTDNIIQQFNIDQIEEAGNEEEPVQALKNAFNQPEDPDMDELEKSKIKILELEKENKEFSESIANKDVEIKTLTSEKEAEVKSFSEYKENEKKSQFSEYLDGVIKEGKMLPANKDANLSMLMNLEGQETLDYSEGEEKGKKTPVDIFKSNLENVSTVIEFGEFAKNGNARISGADDKISKLTQDRMKEKNISFSEASREVLAENQDIVIQHNATGGAE